MSEGCVFPVAFICQVTVLIVNWFITIRYNILFRNVGCCSMDSVSNDFSGHIWKLFISVLVPLFRHERKKDFQVFSLLVGYGRRVGGRMLDFVLR